MQVRSPKVGEPGQVVVYKRTVLRRLIGNVILGSPIMLRRRRRTYKETHRFRQKGSWIAGAQKAPGQLILDNGREAKDRISKHVISGENIATFRPQCTPSSVC